MMFSTPDLYDDNREAVQVAEAGLIHFGAKTVFHGQAATVYCPNDNSQVAEIVKTAGENRILVVAAGGCKDFAFVGDQIAENAIKNDWVGIIVDGCVRDIEILATMPIGIMAIGSTPKSTLKRNQGAKQLNIQWRGLIVGPGDYLYADLNGVLLSTQPLL